MIRLLKYIAFTIVLMGSGISYGQDCTNYHVENCRWADRSYLYSRQSRSAVFTPGMTSEFQMVVYGGEEYYISVGAHRKLGDIRLRIFDDKEKKSLLYDNAKYNYEEYFYFKNTQTRDLIVEITTKEPDNNNETGERYCLGVLVEFKNIRDSQELKEDSVGF